MIEEQFNKTFKGRKVLVTGHTGFKGPWLCIWLKELGAEVIGYSLSPPTTPNNYQLSGLDKRITSIIGDLRDIRKLCTVVEKYEPELVFHLGAQSLVRMGYEDPKLTYETNVMGLVNLLESCKKTGHVKVVLAVTSDKCYENKEWVWGYRESDELGGHDPYSSSKACAELITSAYRRSFFNKDRYGLCIATARAGNVIGGGDWAKDRIFPDCVRALSENRAIAVRNPNARRPWQHVLEPLSGYLWLASQLFSHGRKYKGAWNFGPREENAITVEELVKRVVRIWGGNATYVAEKEHNAYHESGNLQLDSRKAFLELGWRPVLNIEESIEWTSNWYKKYYSGVTQTYDLCLEEIVAYSKRAKTLKLKWA